MPIFHRLLPLFVTSVLLTALPLQAVTHWAGIELTTQTLFSSSLTESQQGTVLVFVSAECPCSLNHESTMRRIAKYFDEYLFLGVHSNADEPHAASHFKENPLGFTILDDPAGELADRYGALKTPHAFVINRKGDVLFSGGVDDSHDPKRAKTHYLERTLVALREIKPIPERHSRALGCTIQRKERLP